MNELNLQQLSDPNKLRLYYHYFLNDVNLVKHVKPSYFGAQSSPLVKIFEISKGFLLKYGKRPTKDEIASILSGVDHTDISLEVISAITDNSIIKSLSHEFVESMATRWLELSNIQQTLYDQVTILKTESTKSVTDIKDKLQKIQKKSEIITNSETKFIDLFDLEKHKPSSLTKLSTGYPFIDKCLGGGYWVGSYNVFMSGTKVGKSAWMVNLAINGIEQGYNVAMVSLELSTDMILQRLACRSANLCMEEYNDLVENDKDRFNEILSAAKSKYKGKISIINLPTSRITPKELENIIVEDEKQRDLKYSLVIIDYVNLLTISGANENSYHKLKTISEEVRGSAVSNDWIIVTPTQTNRGAIRGENISLENISESIAVAQTLDSLFVIETNDNLKSKGQQKLKCALTRGSGYQDYNKLFDVNFNNMTILETNISDGIDSSSEVISDLDKLVNSKTSNPTTFIENVKDNNEKIHKNVNLINSSDVDDILKKQQNLFKLNE